MQLRGKRPEQIEKRLKALFYGAAGVGKTTASISFPHVYLVDTEQGAIHSQYIKLLEKSGGAVFQTGDFDELISEIKTLISTTHPYKTLVIDPLTTLYNDLLDKCAREIKASSKDKDATGTEFGRHYSEANKKMKHLCSLLLRVDMNVIITSHSKNEYGKDMSVLGQTFDCYKKLDYLFDLVFEIQKRGRERVGIVKKSRIETFPDGETFPFNYETIAERYGRDILEKDAIAQALATPMQIAEINRLIELLKISADVTDKWLDKTNAETFEEMPEAAIQKCIDHLKQKINPTQETK